jgi:hypothetical protein
MVRLGRDGTQMEHPLDNFHTVEAAVAAKLRRRLVGSAQFATDVALRTCETALQRTGLVYRTGATLDGGDILALSPEGAALARLAELDEVIT